MAEARAAASLLAVQPPRRPQTAASTTAVKRPHRALVTLSAPPLRSSDAPIVPPELDIVDRQLDTTTTSSDDVIEAQEWAARPATSPCESTVSCGSELEVALSLVSTCAQHNGQGTPLRSRRRHRSPAAAAKQQKQRAKSAAPVVTKRSDVTAAAAATTTAATAVAAAEAKTVVRLHDVFLAYSSGQGTPPRSRRWYRKAASASKSSSSGTAAVTAAAAVPAALTAAPALPSSSGTAAKPHRPVTAPAGTRGVPGPGRVHVAPKA
jgi:hypothetical protein